MKLDPTNLAMSGRIRSLVCSIQLQSIDLLSERLLKDIYIPSVQSAPYTRHKLVIKLHTMFMTN